VGKVNKKSQARDLSHARGIRKESSALFRQESAICAVHHKNFIPATPKPLLSSASFIFQKCLLESACGLEISKAG